MKYKSYNKKDDYSYSFGAFPTIELIESGKELVEVIISDKFVEKDELVKKLEDKDIPYSINDKLIERISNKGNVYVVGVFKKYREKILDERHLILYEISDMGNLGTIIRTALAFGYKNIAIVASSIDVFNPKVIRGSMGAIFKVRIEVFENIESYKTSFKDREIFAFMLDHKAEKINNIENIENRKFSLVFGNEGSGLPNFFKDFARPLFIPQTDEVDSLNLTIAAGIGMFFFERVIR